ncbi:hypothetical protein AGMMS50222_01970 [Endomicrobiia bacterium]|nr:hypothetical protein AGMMS49556_04630 [Endomicrobiia bacterium]GHT73831.1 hypothetical protein AGMMS50222_01970 [Endomicrobiia bacterium]
MKIKKVLTAFFLFSLALSSCDKKNAELVNRRRKYVDPDKSVALTPAPQQDNVDVDHANPVGECSICVDKIEISDDYVTCTVCNRLFHIECIKSWWKCNSCELSDRGCCPAPACKTRIQIPVAKNLNFNLDLD